MRNSIACLLRRGVWSGAAVLPSLLLAQGGGGAQQRQCDITFASWLVMAPFAIAPGATQQDLGDVATLSPREGQGWTGKVWQRVALNAQGRLDLGSLFATAATSNAVIYAFTYLASPADRNVTVGVEGNGTVAIWVNGALIDRKAPGGRGNAATQDTVVLPLKRGLNRVLYQLVNRNGAPGMSARFLASSVAPYGDVAVSDAPDVSVPSTTDVVSRFRVGPVTTGSSITLVGSPGAGRLVVPLSICAARSANDPGFGLFTLGESRASLLVPTSATARPVGTIDVAWGDLARAVSTARPTLAGALVSAANVFTPTEPELRGSAGIAITAPALLDMLSRPIETTGWLQTSSPQPPDSPTASGWAPLDVAVADSAIRRALVAIRYATKVPPELGGLSLEIGVGEFRPQSQITVNGRVARADSLGRVIVCAPCTAGSDLDIQILLRGARWWDPPVLRVSDLGWHEIHDGATWARYFTRDTTIAVPGETIASQLATAALSMDKSQYHAIVNQWLTMLAPAAAKIRRDTVDIVGNSHIDAAWQWRWPETQDVVDRTWATATKLMAKYPDMHFAASAARYYEWVEDRKPDLLQRIQGLAKDGRWDPVGGWWLEPDVELPSGESLVRQALYGQRSFIRLFGAPARVAWIPDSFGYPFSLPQILLKSGTDFFVTQKVRWNTSNKWPATLNQFWWEGVDGSRIFTYIPYGYDHDLAASKLAPQIMATKDSSAIDKSMVLYGVGDHGGGPTMQMLERSHDLKRIPTFPVLRDDSPADALTRMRTAMPKDSFVLKDELYPEYHRGVWVSQSQMKMWNRHMEGLLLATEAAATLSPEAYPGATLTKAWEGTLFNQFHDLLPGSGITPIYVDAKNDYRVVDTMASHVLDGSLRAIARPLDTRPVTAGDVPVLVFNPSGTSRSDIVEITPPSTPPPGSPGAWAAFDPSGAQLRSEPADSGRIRVRVSNVPAIGGKIIFLRHSPLGDSVVVTTHTAAMENAYLRVEIDFASGSIARILDKVNNREVLTRKPGTSDLVLLYDNPTRQDAWEIDNVTGERSWISARAGASAPMVGRNGMGSSVTVQRGRDSSLITQRYFLGDSARRLDVETTVEWTQAHHMLEAVFPLAFHIDSSYAEIPYAVMPRPTRAINKVDSARFEAPMLRFVDGSSRGYGVAIESNGISGYNASGDTLFLSLLRAPKSPDATADMGTHHFTYSIVPHAGDWRAPAVLDAARSLNQPLRATVVDAHAGTGRVTTSALTITGGTVDLGALKRAEDSGAWVVRLIETTGKPTTATLRFARPIGTVVDADLLERPTGVRFPVAGQSVSIPMKPWEIKTLVVSPR